MSSTYALLCTECKQFIWIGQRTGFHVYVYIDQRETMELLNDFLRRHENHNLVFCDDIDLDVTEYENVRSFPSDEEEEQIPYKSPLEEQAIKFDGSDDYIETPPWPHLSGETMSLWIKTDGKTVSHVVEYKPRFWKRLLHKIGFKKISDWRLK